MTSVSSFGFHVSKSQEEQTRNLKLETRNLSVAWITGGGTGIGRALAALLYQQGMSVVITGRRLEVLEEARRSIESSSGPGKLLTLAGDASDAVSVQRTADIIHERLGPIDLLVNNAGVLLHHPTRTAPLEDFEQSFKWNCLSAVLCTKAVLPGMLARKNGMIVNVSSIVGKWASPHTPAYSMTKYALSGFTHSLRQELRQTGIHVMVVYPGYIMTPMTDPYAHPSKRRWGAPPESMARAIWKGIQRRKRSVYYPWYVFPALALHALWPSPMEWLRAKIEKEQ